MNQYDPPESVPAHALPDRETATLRALLRQGDGAGEIAALSGALTR